MTRSARGFWWGGGLALVVVLGSSVASCLSGSAESQGCTLTAPAPAACTAPTPTDGHLYLDLECCPFEDPAQR